MKTTEEMIEAINKGVDNLNGQIEQFMHYLNKEEFEDFFEEYADILYVAKAELKWFNRLHSIVINATPDELDSRLKAEKSNLFNKLMNVRYNTNPSAMKNMVGQLKIEVARKCIEFMQWKLGVWE
ncbi:MAG: hypothetical protein NC324_03110 [Bacteroides sp.]|nr:hypothetical protein [Bacteroides sp.]